MVFALIDGNLHKGIPDSRFAEILILENKELTGEAFLNLVIVAGPKQDFEYNKCLQSNFHYFGILNQF
ncbi:MAG: hypothetical protein NVS1B13_14780 [Flavisolibacter sp.]